MRGNNAWKTNRLRPVFKSDAQASDATPPITPVTSSATVQPAAPLDSTTGAEASSSRTLGQFPSVAQPNSGWTLPKTGQGHAPQAASSSAPTLSPAKSSSGRSRMSSQAVEFVPSPKVVPTSEPSNSQHPTQSSVRTGEMPMTAGSEEPVGHVVLPSDLQSYVKPPGTFSFVGAVVLGGSATVDVPGSVGPGQGSCSIDEPVSERAKEESEPPPAAPHAASSPTHSSGVTTDPSSPPSRAAAAPPIPPHLATAQPQPLMYDAAPTHAVSLTSAQGVSHKAFPVGSTTPWQDAPRSVFAGYTAIPGRVPTYPNPAQPSLSGVSHEMFSVPHTAPQIHTAGPMDFPTHNNQPHVGSAALMHGKVQRGYVPSIGQANSHASAGGNTVGHFIVHHQAPTHQHRLAPQPSQPPFSVSHAYPVASGPYYTQPTQVVPETVHSGTGHTPRTESPYPPAYPSHLISMGSPGTFSGATPPPPAHPHQHQHSVPHSHLTTHVPSHQHLPTRGHATSSGHHHVHPHTSLPPYPGGAHYNLAGTPTTGTPRFTGAPVPQQPHHGGGPAYAAPLPSANFSSQSLWTPHGGAAGTPLHSYSGSIGQHPHARYSHGSYDTRPISHQHTQIHSSYAPPTGPHGRLPHSTAPHVAGPVPPSTVSVTIGAPSYSHQMVSPHTQTPQVSPYLPPQTPNMDHTGYGASPGVSTVPPSVLDGGAPHANPLP